MGINLRLSSSASGTRNVLVNMGGGANLVQRSLFSTSTPTLAYSQWYTPGSGSPALSTSDYYQMFGMWRVFPYDLDTMGSEGAAIKAREGGKRYIWVIGCDHPGLEFFQGAVDFYVGYSHDPQILPQDVRLLFIASTQYTHTDPYGLTQTNFSCYHWPYLVYNPDAVGNKFWVYAEGQANGREHELGLFTTSDFLTTTFVGCVNATTNFGAGWGSLAYVNRLGVNSWEMYCLGTTDGTLVTAVDYRYTSSDGLTWARANNTVRAGPGQYTTISGQKYLLTVEAASGNSYVSLLAVDSSNVSLGTYTRISTAFGDNTSDPIKAYPGPTYLQDVAGYEEDGILSIYATRGFSGTASTNGLNTGPYLGNVPTYVDIVGGITGGVLTVTSNPGGYPLLVGYRLTSVGRNITTDNGNGTYNVDGSGTTAPGTTITVCRNGGLWHEFIDLYYYVTDASAAVNAAPLGTTADCTSGLVTISWSDCLPNRTYRVYRGTTAGTQATLIGDVTGTSITNTPIAGSQYFYKVVTLNSGVEQKSRVVSVYASNNSRMVNRHVNRVINDGGDTSKIDMTFLASVDSYLSSNDYYKYLMFWVDARFGVKLDGSGFISKIYCLGTTRLPVYGDYTPTTSNTFPSTSSNTSYSTTSFRGTTPSWINNAASAHGYFGNGRYNNIQKKNEITVIAAYQRASGTGVASLLSYGQFSGMYLTQATGASGNVTFALSPYQSGSFTPATVPFASATAAHVAAGVFDGTNVTAYLDGIAGTPVSASAYANPNMTLPQTLRGSYGVYSGQNPVLASGGQDTRYDSGGTYNISNHALFTGAGLIGFEKGLPAAVTSITAMYA